MFLIEINNGLEYGDYREMYKIVVDKDIPAASIKAVEFMKENYSNDSYGQPSFHVKEIKEVDGYKINLIKK